MDLSRLQQLAKAEIEENQKKKENSSNGPKILYPVDNGKFRIKLLYKEEAGIVQKKIIRHNIGNDKIPCLSTYGVWF